jgi:cytochrome c oxidase subunit 1
MFIQGMAGVSRRLADGGEIYAHAQNVLFWNKFMSMSAWTLFLFQIPFIINLFRSMKSGERVSENPWDATTLEWSAPSPPLPHMNFEKTPVVSHGPYEYSVPGQAHDFVPQHAPALAHPAPARGH